MNKSYQGFIFFMTLIITSVISLLVLTSMQHVLLYYRAINRQEMLHQKFYQLEEIALQLVQKKITSMSTHCITHIDSANKVIFKLTHHEGCALKKGELDYEYIIEDLGEFPCLMVHQGRQKLATHHRRISIAEMGNGVANSVLQIRFITAGLILKCDGKGHFISMGVSSWRYFSSLEANTIASSVKF